MTEAYIAKGPGVTRVGLESTFGTVAGTMDACFPTETPSLDLDQTALRIKAESANMFDNKGVKRTLKSVSKGKIKFTPRCHATRLISGASVTRPPDMHVLKAILGGERIVEGTTVGTVASGNAFNVADGTKIKPFVPLLVEKSSNVFEIGVPQSVATNAVTMRYDLSGSPLATTGKVVNLAAWYPTATNTQSFSIETVDAQSDHTMRRALGCTGGLKFAFPREDLVTYESDVMIADWAEGNGLGIPTALQTDSQAADRFSMDGAHCIMQAPGTHTRAFVNLFDVEVELYPSMIHRKNTAGNGVQNVLGTMRTPPDNNVFVKITPRFYYDRDLETNWDSGYTAQFGVFCYSGSGASMRVFGFYCPLVLLASKPMREEDGKVLLLKCTLEGMLNTSGADELEQSQIIFVAG